jgi:hypothetical protein
VDDRYKCQYVLLRDRVDFSSTTRSLACAAVARLTITRVHDERAGTVQPIVTSTSSRDIIVAAAILAKIHGDLLLLSPITAIENDRIEFGAVSSIVVPVRLNFELDTNLISKRTDWWCLKLNCEMILTLRSDDVAVYWCNGKS